MPDTSRVARYETALDFAERQVAALVDRYPDYFPIYTTQGRWHHAGELWTDWTSGFLVGMMWLFHRRALNGGNNVGVGPLADWLEQSAVLAGKLDSGGLTELPG